jgi:DNA-binding NarL/FixJ family response regulator
VDARQSGVRGSIPTSDTTLGLALRRTSRRDLAPPPGHVAAERFTPPQIALLHHLKLCKANKSIARALAMSESTVIAG